MIALITRGAALVLAAVLIAGPVHAQPVQLDDTEASRTVQALEALNDAGLLREGSEPQPDSAEANQTAAIIREHGFSPTEWMAALHGVTDGYVALKAGRLYDMPGAENEFEAMRQAIINNPNIDDTTRQQTLDELERRLGPQVAESPLAETVAPYEDRLDQVFQEGVAD